jgi:tRNA(Ile)-lysidine synthase
VDTAGEARRAPREAAAEDGQNFPADSIEGTARRLRYAWFRRLLTEIPLDAVATAHTRNDQAETVLGKFLRGAWTEGLSGIHSVLKFPEGLIIRPLLGTTRAEIEAWLKKRDQAWREDSTNRQLTFTRNRIRHELLPLLETWNPRLQEHLAQVADLARDEEAYWQPAVERIAEQVIIRGRPVRGGGRANTGADGIALDLARLAAEPISVQRRVLRFAAGELGAAPDFAATEALRSLASLGKGGQKLELAHGLRAERMHREMRLSIGPDPEASDDKTEQYECVIPGELTAPRFGCRVRLEVMSSDVSGSKPQKAVLRSWRPGDRVHLRYASGSRKIKEVLERMKVTGSERIHWPVLEVGGRILWMRGVELEPHAGIRVWVEGI